MFSTKLSLIPSSPNGSTFPASKLIVLNSLRAAAWKLYLNMEMYSIQIRNFGTLLVFTKNPPNTIIGIVKTGSTAIATSSFGTNTETHSP